MTKEPRRRWLHNGPDYELRVGKKWAMVAWKVKGLKIERMLIAKNGDTTHLPDLKRHGKRSWLWPHGPDGLEQAKKEALRWLLAK